MDYLSVQQQLFSDNEYILYLSKLGIRIVNHFDILGRIQYKPTNFEGNQCEIVVIS